MNNHPEDKDIKAILEVMNELVKKKDEPCVGIFWYDTEENDTFGVQTAFIDDSKVLDNSPCGSEVRTIKVTHKHIWDSQKGRNKDSRFNEDYHKFPRGRVFYIDGKMVVMTGEWINEYPQAKELIILDFILPSITNHTVILT